jgi:hypothetical protein
VAKIQRGRALIARSQFARGMTVCQTCGASQEQQAAAEDLCHPDCHDRPVLRLSGLTTMHGADSTMIRKATRADRPRISEIRFRRTPRDAL